MKKIKRVVVIAVISVCIAGYYWYAQTISSYAACFTSYVLYPVLKIQQTFVEPVALCYKHYKAQSDYALEIARLQQDRDLLQAQLIAMKASQVYEDEAKELLQFKKRYALNAGYITQVLVKHFSELAHYFFVDAGSNHGIKQDMVVIYCNTLVGRVTEVYPWYSKVCLISDRDCKVAVYGDQSRCSGIHEGINQEDWTQLSYVGHLTPATPNELVLSSGQGLIFPQGFGVGKVVSAVSDGLYQKVQVSPLCNLRSINYCMIIAKDALG